MQKLTAEKIKAFGSYLFDLKKCLSTAHFCGWTGEL